MKSLYKGVTYESSGVARFPDAPTQRGVKHIQEMINAVENGFEGNIFFLIQMDRCRYFTTYDEIDPVFSKTLREASKKGVNILAYTSIVNENSIAFGNKVEVKLVTFFK